MTTTIKFYGRPILATQRNTKLLMLVFYPGLLLLSYASLFFSAWALSDVLNVTMWLTLPVTAALCLEFGSKALLPKVLRTTLLRGLLAMSLYVFWQSGEFVKFSLLAVFTAHQLAHLALTRYWAHKEQQAKERAEMQKGLTDLGYGQRAPSSEHKH